MTVIRKDLGQVYTFGSGVCGQLGTRNKKARHTPALVADLARYRVISVACGHLHSLALTQDGSLFAWGYLTSDHLGLSESGTCNHRTENSCLIGEEYHSAPILVTHSRDLAVARMFAGGYHSAVVTGSGVINCKLTVLFR